MTHPVDDAVRHLDPITLDELTGRAGLQDRFDTKFIVYPALVRRLTALMGSELQVLEIDGGRRFRYGSMYFDTPGWRSYRDHVQGRRRRFKARTRHYQDGDLCMFEVKLEGTRGSTEKLRVPHPVDEADRLTPAAAEHLRVVLAEARIAPADNLRPALRTEYRRTTLVHADRTVRLTLDTDLVCSGSRGSVSALDDRVLLEVKTATGHDPLLTALHRLGARPVSVSKYCAGVALLHPEVPRARWAQVIREHFADAA